MNGAARVSVDPPTSVRSALHWYFEPTISGLGTPNPLEDVDLSEQNTSSREATARVADTASPLDAALSLSIQRRSLLFGGAAAVAAGALSSAAPAAAAPAEAHSVDLASALARFRASIPAHFDPNMSRTRSSRSSSPASQGERPIADDRRGAHQGERAAPRPLGVDLRKVGSRRPEEGVTVFLQGLEKRGDDNLRKRIYMSAVTPDLYRRCTAPRWSAFFDGLLDPKFAGKPFMRHYLDYYWDIYWDLHLGVKGDAIPPQVRTIGESFNTVLAFRDPTQPIVYDNYMTVRALLDFLKDPGSTSGWTISQRARIANPEKTIAWYWLKNAGDGAHFARRTWSSSASTTSSHSANGATRSSGSCRASARTAAIPKSAPRSRRPCRAVRMTPNGAPYTPLEMFVMELFRMISPNGGSISSISDTRNAGSSDNYGDSGSPFVRFGLPYERSGYMISPHTRPASIRCTGPIRSNSIRSATGTCRPAPRWTRREASRSASPNARSTSPR